MNLGVEGAGASRQLKHPGGQTLAMELRHRKPCRQAGLSLGAQFGVAPNLADRHLGTLEPEHERKPRHVCLRAQPRPSQP
jgi:hypothetical protein